MPRTSFSKPTFNILKAYRWPGNIRELRNLCERLSILMAGQVIAPENLPPEFLPGIAVNLPKDYVLPTEGVNLENLEAELIFQALARTNGNRSHSARLLGITRDALLYRIEKYGITDKSIPSDPSEQSEQTD
jgi:DNA-binding NtrC family response regulator